MSYISNDFFGKYISSSSSSIVGSGSLLSSAINIFDLGALGDGVQDATPFVQKAFAVATLNPGSTIIFPYGTYLVRGMLQIPAQTTLAGAGGIIKILTATTASQQVLFRADANDVTVRDLTFDGSLCAANFGESLQIFKGTGARFVLKDNKFLNVPYSSLDGKESFNICVLDSISATITGNYIAQSGGDSIDCYGGYYYVANNYIFGSGERAIVFKERAHGTIEGNYIERCVTGIGSGPMGNTTDSDPLQKGINIIGNNVVNCSFGISMGSFFTGRTPPTSVSIVGNTLRECNVGINFDGNVIDVTAITVSSNNITALGKNSAYWSFGPGGFVGIRIVGDGNPLISGNSISGSYVAGAYAMLIGGSWANVIGNTIAGNKLGEGFAFERGIDVNSAISSSVGLNVITGATLAISPAVATGGNQYVSNLVV